MASGHLGKAGVEPVVVTFSATWFHARYGVDYSEETWLDPVRRIERNRELERVIYERFGDVGLGSKDPQPAPNLEFAYGNYFAPALFGCEVKYPADQAPGNKTLEDSSFEAMRALAVPDFDTNPVMQRAWSDWRVLKEKYGDCSVGLGVPSPINTAVNMYGEQFLLACALEPETAQHVMRVLMETHFKLYHEFCAKIEPEKFPTENIAGGYGNCPAIMFSPRLYREVILPIDKEWRSRYGSFGIHHCGVFDAYIDLYKELAPTSLDIGGGSNYHAIREAFPEIPFSMIVNAPDIEGRTTGEIDNLVGNMVEGASPVDKISYMWVAEVSQKTEDETIRAVRTANERI
jgi:hypothetical protein